MTVNKEESSTIQLDPLANFRFAKMFRILGEHPLTFKSPAVPEMIISLI